MKTFDTFTSVKRSPVDDTVRVTSLKFVTFRAYENLLKTDILTTGYDCQFAIKQTILDVLDYLIDTFSPHGMWDAKHVLLLCRVSRPQTTIAQAFLITRTVREVLCEELAVPPKGFRLLLKRQGEFIYYIPVEENGYDYYSPAHAGAV